jgi:F-type H+-transporting ATPase subunit a
VTKRRVLGCSFPLFIGIAIGFFALLLVGFLAGPIGKALFPSINAAMPWWLVVRQPEIRLPAEAIFSIAGLEITNSIIAAWITIAVLVVIFYFATRNSKLVPGKFQNFVEWVLSYIWGLCEGVAGQKNGRRFFPLIATIFLMVITNAWLNLIPGFGSIGFRQPEAHLIDNEVVVPFLRGANTDINMTLALALYSFCFVVFWGFKSHRIHYLVEFFNFGPLFHGFKLLFTGHFKQGLGAIFNGAITAFVGILEFLSTLVRIISFTFRLFGNMTAGEILLLVMTFIMPFMVSIIFYGLELFVGYVQALIFAGLTLVFVSVATSSREEETAHSH